MEKRRPYNKLIEDKLGHLPGADADRLWEGMHALLDKEMPQKEDRRRILGWMRTSKGFMMLAACLLPICYLALHSLTTSKTTHPQLPGQSRVSNPAPGTALRVEEKNGTTSNHEAVNSFKNKNNQEEPTAAGIPAPDQHKNTVASLTSSFDIKQPVTNSRRKEKSSYPRTLPPEDRSGPSIPVPAITDPGTVNRQRQAQPTLDGSLYTAFVSKGTPGISRSMPSILLADSMALAGNTGLKGLPGQPKTTRAAFGLGEDEHGPYIGILVGMDLSSIHFKSMKTGANKGFVVGYAFNKRWSVESGLFWNTKRFLSDGHYFRPDNYTLPTGVHMLTVNGKNELYEWPVNVKYSLLTQRHGLFITGGISSYYMKSERYDYEYEQNGITGKSYASYKNETKNWFSVVNFSLGYTYKIGTRGKIRVEPYLKLPIKDLGINNMPVMSTGINLGFTRQLFK